ncbi:MAG: serine hydrolase domain-containing protein [Myxococcota bacterium]
MISRTLIAVVFALLPVAPAKAGVSPTEARDGRLRAARAWLEAQVDTYLVPGAAAAIVHDQDVVFAHGLGVEDTATEAPVTPDTRFSVCSISKLFTSTAVMMLRDRGKLRLDEPLARYINDLKLDRGDLGDDPVTVRDTLSHVAGVPRDGPPNQWVGMNFPTRAMLLDAAATQTMLYDPSTTFQYSNVGMALLGLVVEKVSGKPHNKFVEDEIMAPLGMKTATADLPNKELGKGFSRGYNLRSKSGPRKPIDPYTLDALSPAAGVAASVNDLASFARWQFRLLDTGKTELLERATLREMHRGHVHDVYEDSTFGLGYYWIKHDGDPLVGHGGWCPGYRASFFMHVPDAIAVTVMVNVNDADPIRMGQQIYGLTAGAIIAAEDGQSTTTDDAKNWSDYEGRYQFGDFSSALYIAPGEDGLDVISLNSDAPSSDITTLVPSDDDDVFVRKLKRGDTGEPVRFERDAAGNVVALWWHNQRYPQR